MEKDKKTNFIGKAAYKTNVFFSAKKPWLRKNWKKLVFIGIPVLLILIAILKPKGFNPTTDIVEAVQKQNLRKTVQATGTITSIVDLNLGFNTPGTVQTISAKLGNSVYKGQILATLQAQSELGTLNQALGALKAAQAALKKTQEGATTEEVAVSEAALHSAEIELQNVTKEQNLNVQNTYRTLMSSNLAAVPIDSASGTATAPVISGTYNGGVEGDYVISVYPTGSGNQFSVSGLGTGSGSVTSSFPVPLSSQGLYIQFPTTINNVQSRFSVSVPNKQSSSYVTNLNAYESAQEARDSAIRTAEAVVEQKQAELALKKAQARPADLEAKEADVLSAEGRVETAQGAYEDKIIRAPANGKITKVDIKLGQTVETKKAVVTLQDNGELFVEANVNESDIAELAVGQKVSFTVDTYGPSEVFDAVVSSIDLAPTNDGTIVNYKVKAQVTSGLEKIKTGGTANISILIYEKPDVVIVPQRVVIQKNGKSFVEVVTDERRGKTKEREVVLGQKGDGGLIEVKEGLSPEEKVLFRSK